MYTTHWNLPLLPTGAVDWMALINDLVNKLEAGRTLKLTAYEALAKGKAVYVDGAGKARLATNATRADGVWQSAATATDAQGYGQLSGTMSDAGWAWTPGGLVYATAAGALTQAQPAGGVPVAVALTATQILIAGRLRLPGPSLLPAYTVGTLPAAADWTDGMVIITDEAGGRVPAFSDGTDWRRVTDRAVVS